MTARWREKIRTRVNFPFAGLDMAPFTTDALLQAKRDAALAAALDGMPLSGATTEDCDGDGDGSAEQDGTGAGAGGSSHSTSAAAAAVASREEYGVGSGPDSASRSGGGDSSGATAGLELLLRAGGGGAGPAEHLYDLYAVANHIGKWVLCLRPSA